MRWTGNVAGLHRWARLIALASATVIVLALLWVVSSPVSSDQPGMPPTFGGFACRTGTCGAHRLGYETAARLRVANVADCARGSMSFQEGCRTWVERGPGQIAVGIPRSQ